MKRKNFFSQNLIAAAIINNLLLLNIIKAKNTKCKYINPILYN